MLLAKVLYGKQAKQNLNQDEKLETKSGNTKKLNVHFCHNVGKMVLDSTILSEEERENEFDFMWRTQDYSFQAIKINEDFNRDEDGVKTDVFVFNRQHSSEFDPSHEELKDDLLAWNIRYKQRLEEKNKKDPS